MIEFALKPDLLVHLFLTLLHSVWQIGLLALVTFACGRLLPRKSVEWRYAFHVAALFAALLALPVTFWMIQGSDSSAVELVGLPFGSSNTTEMGDFVTDGSAAPSHGSQLIGGVAGTSGFALAPELRSEVPVNVTMETDSPSRAASDMLWLPSLAIWALAVYLLGVVIMLTRLLISMLRVNQLARGGRSIGDTPAIEVLQRLSHCWSMKVVPRLLIAEQCVVPQVVGLIRPAILLPASALSGLSPSELEMILAHELAHLRRHDLWVNLIQRLAEATLFFNPGLWYLSHRISVLREYCCDESACAVVQSGHSESPRLRYAQALLRVVELEQGAKAHEQLASLAAVGRSPSELRNRVARLFDEPLGEPLRLSRGGVAMIAATVILLVCGSVFSNPQLRNEEDPSVAEAIVEEQSEDMVQIRLQHGGTLRLHALTSPKNPAMGWWSPKGRKIDAKEDWTRHRNNWADTELIAIMEAVFTEESSTAGPDGEKWALPLFFAGRVHISDDGTPTTVGGFGTGPWASLGKVSLGETLGDSNFSVDFTKLETLGQTIDRDGKLFPAPLISCEVKQNPQLDFALIAVDKKGTRAKCGVTCNPNDRFESANEVWKLWQSTQGGVDATNFSHLEVLTRKRAWAEFSGFAIQPKLIESVPTVRRLPAIAKEPAAKSDKNDTPAKVSGTIVLEDGSPATAKGWMYTDVRRGQKNRTYGTSGTQDQFMDEFSFEIGSGEVYLTHFADGYAPAWTEKFELASGEHRDDIRLVLKRGFSAPVLVRDEQGQPVPGATITALPEVHGKIHAPSVKHPANKNGEVVLQHLANTRYQLEISAPGFQPLRTAPLRIESGESFRPTMVRSQPSTGIIRFADGTPAPNTKLRCVYEERADGKGVAYRNEGGGFWGSVLTTTDAQGRFKLDELAEGSQYVMIVEAVDGARAIVRSIASNKPDLQIVLPRRRDLIVKLEGDLSRIQVGNDKLSIDFRQRVTSVFKSGHRRGDLIGAKFPVELSKDGRTVIFRGLAVDLDGPDAGKQKVEVFLSGDRKNKQTVDLNLEAGTIVEFELPDPVETSAARTTRPSD